MYNESEICFRFDAHLSRAAFLASLVFAGSINRQTVIITAITTSNSINVNALLRCLFVPLLRYAPLLIRLHITWDTSEQAARLGGMLVDDIAEMAGG